MSWIQLIFLQRILAEFSWFSSQEYELNSVDFLAKRTSWNQLIFQPRIRAKINWFSSQENELKSADFLAKIEFWLQWLKKKKPKLSKSAKALHILLYYQHFLHAFWCQSKFLKYIFYMDNFMSTIMISQIFLKVHMHS